ncbi:MAG: sugar phosphate nucleotidyltransferase [Chlamydiales bacterium]
MKILILAGGSGTRLWPLSRANYPKQFLQLFGKESFLQKTLRRNLEIAQTLYILTNEVYFYEVLKQVKEIDPNLESHIILEPEQKDTAPAIAYAFEKIEEDGVFLITPADHMINPVDKYHEAILKAEDIALKGDLVAFGVHPNRPATEYGYIKLDGRDVEAFIEKPDFKTACHYLESGNYFWNSGMVALTKETFRREAGLHAPELIEAPFSKMPNISFDYAIMEKSERIFMLPLDLSWSDIGSWENVYEFLQKDEAQNAICGNVITHQTKNSLIHAENRLVSTIGIEDLVVVETDDVVLVAKKTYGSQIKEMVEKLKKLGKKEILEHLTIRRPWGTYTVLMKGERYKIKWIEVYPKQKLSLQMHYHRSEHWVIVNGTARVTISDQEQCIHEGESIFVPKSSIHRVENPGKVSLEIIEVQVGEYLEEDDIIRLEDIYGRLKEDTAFNLLRKKFDNV